MPYYPSSDRFVYCCRSRLAADRRQHFDSLNGNGGVEYGDVFKMRVDKSRAAYEYTICRTRCRPAGALLGLGERLVGSGQEEIVEYAARVGVQVIDIIFFAIHLFVYDYAAVADGI